MTSTAIASGHFCLLGERAQQAGVVEAIEGNSVQIQTLDGSITLNAECCIIVVGPEKVEAFISNFLVELKNRNESLSRAEFRSAFARILTERPPLSEPLPDVLLERVRQIWVATNNLSEASWPLGQKLLVG